MHDLIFSIRRSMGCNSMSISRAECFSVMGCFVFHKEIWSSLLSHLTSHFE